MHLILYTSKYTGSEENLQSDIDHILSSSRSRNAEENITGIFFQHRHRFLQFLEGEEATVKSCLDRINRDPRHESIELLVDEAVTDRGFEGWAMDFLPINSEVDVTAELLRNVVATYRRNLKLESRTLAGVIRGMIESLSSSRVLM